MALVTGVMFGPYEIRTRLGTAFHNYGDVFRSGVEAPGSQGARRENAQCI